jgi:tetratricopeptide (TPR) repeat protein
MSEQRETLFASALLARRERQLEAARTLLMQAESSSRRAGDDLDLARSLVMLGQIERDQHHLDASLKLYEEAVAIYRKKGDLQKLAHTVRHVGDIQRNLENMQLAEPCYREALDLYRADANTGQLDLANALRGYAILKGDLGDRPHARALWAEAGKLYEAVGVKEGVAESARRLALLAE